MTAIEHIDAEIKKRGLSRRELAIKAGIPLSDFQEAMERNDTWTGDMVSKVAAALDMSLDELSNIIFWEASGDPTNDIPDYPPEIAALAKAAEPLREYLLQRGDPHSCVVVTQYGATLKRDEIGVPFAKDGERDFETKRRRVEADIEQMRREMEGIL